MLINEIKRRKWADIGGRWVQPPISGVFWCHCWESKAIKELLEGEKLSSILFLDGYVPMSEKDDFFIERFIADIFKSGTVSLFRLRFEHIAEEYKDDHLSVLYDECGDDKEFIKKLFGTYVNLASIWWFTVIAGKLQDFILEKKLAGSEEELFEKIKNKPRIEKNLLEKQIAEQDILARFLAGNKNKTGALYKSVKEHSRYFNWVGTHHWWGDEYTPEKCLVLIKEKARSKNIKKPDASEEMIALLRSFIFWRTHLAEIADKVICNSRKRLTKFAKTLGFQYDELIYFSGDEILRSFSDKKYKESLMNSKQVIRERKKGYGCFVDSRGREHIFTGSELDGLIRDKIAKDADGEMLKGSVASVGPKVSAKVKIVFRPEDFFKFKKGDILVAPETSPTFAVLMKKARAVITDKGGLTSHAAIISRELGIPCIIGTKNATLRLKDNMTVEVDTKNNSIKIINENSKE